MKKIKEWWVVSGIILFCLLIAFYWFQVRPSYAIKSCSKEMEEKYNNNYIYSIDYKECLVRKGIEVELK